MRPRNSYYLTSAAWTAWFGPAAVAGAYAKDGGRYDF